MNPIISGSSSSPPVAVSCRVTDASVPVKTKKQVKKMSENEQPNIYVLNAPIIPDYGSYVYEPLTTEAARDLLRDGFTSAVGHKTTADVLTQLLSIEVPVNRIEIHFKPGDRALVFKLNRRLPEGVVLETIEEIEAIGFSLGVITRVR